MPDHKDPHLLTDDAVDYTIVPYTQLPVSSQRAAQRRSIPVRGHGQSSPDRPRDPSTHVDGNCGEILADNVGMVDDSVAIHRRGRVRFHASL